MYILIFAISFILIFLFFACVLLYPELVGIAGKKAREIEDAHASKQKDQSP